MNVLDKTTVHNCTSCQMCAAVCPKSAISIKLDEEGFYRPVIDDTLCVDCRICIHVCYKFDKDVKMTSNDALVTGKKIYATRPVDKSLLPKVSSGGLGDIIAKELVKQGYTCIGVVYNPETNLAENRVANSIEETDAFRGSKYIQSYSFPAFKQLVKEVRNKKYAVFGTPCQIYSVSRFLEMKHLRENAILIDLYCHGCPSMNIWLKYTKEIRQKKHLGRFDDVIFRSKVKGWGNFYVLVIIVGGKSVFVSSPKEDGFYELFFSDTVLNESCNDCKLRSTLEYTDIRLGDFWGKRYAMDGKGVSGLTITSERGENVLKAIKDRIESSEADFKEFLAYQSWGHVIRPDAELRKIMMESLKDEKQSTNDCVKVFYSHQGMRRKMKRMVNTVLYYLPYQVKGFLKKIL